MAHSARLRVEALKRVFKRGEKVSSVCLSLDILPRTFYRWKRKFLSLPKERREEILASEVPPSEWKIKPSDLRLEILKLVVSYPGLSSRLIYEKLLEEGLKVSPTAFVNFLRRHKLATKNQRREYAVLYESIHSTRASVPQKGVNLAQRRKRMVEEVIYAGRPVVDVCYEFGVSGPTFYKWKERYRQAVKKDENLLEAMEDQLLTGAEHPRGISKKLERKILDNVILNPRSSSIKLAKYLPVTNHGIQNVLARNGLNHQPSRELFATQVRNGEVDYPLSLRLRWAFVWENVWQLPKFTFHYWPRMVGGWLLLGLAALVTGGGLYGWLKVVFTTPGAAPLGLFFASISLAIGGIFFLYSFKYYFSLALVLSFSRRKGLRGGLLNGSGLPWVSNASGNNEEVLEMSSQDDSRNDSRRRLGLIDRITRLGNPVTRREDGGIRGAGGVWKWLFGSSVRDNANSSLINGEIGELELERKPFVSIHLPMFNEKRVARRVIEACASMEYFDEQGRPHFEVLVCDDSTDETVEIVEQVAEEINSKLKVSSFAKATEDRQKSKTYNLQPTTRQPARQAYNLVRVLHRPTREGFKGGALKHALETMDPRTEFIMVFDADFVPFSDTIDQFLRHFQFVCKGLSIKEIKKSKAAAVTGYQWHVLNKGENWVTKGVRTEYSGSYLVERPARELMGGLKIIHGSVYMIRADVLKETGWGTSITEDFELTLRLYEKGYKVVFTPYVQAPAECVSTIKRLIRQRMRWAEGHGNNVRKMFKRLMLGKWEESEKLKVKSEKLQAPSYATMQPCNYDKQKKHSYIARWLHSLVGRAPSRASRFVPSPLSFMEKIELLYLAPYYLQAALFLIGNISWLVAELVFRTSLPFWTSIWGWSMVLTNLFALPLVNSVGLFIEESEKDDYLGILSFVALCYLLVPFQAYASVKGFIEKEEGTWFRTPKTGKVTISLMRSRFARLVKIFFPLGDNQEQSPISVEKTTTSRRSALNIFDGLSGSAQKLRPALYGVGHTTLLVLLLISTVLFNFAPLIESGSAPIIGNSLGIAYAEEPESNADKQEKQDLAPSSSPLEYPRGDPEPVEGSKEPGMTVLDNRNPPGGEAGLPLAPVTEGGLIVVEHNPQSTPEDFYLSVDRLSEISSAGKFLEAIQLPAELEGREISEGVGLAGGIAEDILLTSPNVPQGSLKEIKGENYLPYYWLKLGDTYLVLLKSEKGVQAYVLDTQSLTIALMELPDGADKFELKALSKPVYQYRGINSATTNDCSSAIYCALGWEDYTELSPAEVTVEKSADMVIFTQKYNLIAANASSGRVQGETEFKIGFDGEEYTNKFTFRLGDNENVNRVLWENRLMDGSSCESIGTTSEPSGEDEEVTIVPVPSPSPDSVQPDQVSVEQPQGDEGSPTLPVSPVPITQLADVLEIEPNEETISTSPSTVEAQEVGKSVSMMEKFLGIIRWLSQGVSLGIGKLVSAVRSLFDLLHDLFSLNVRSLALAQALAAEKNDYSLATDQDYLATNLTCGDVKIDWSDFGETDVVANFNSRQEERGINSATTTYHLPPTTFSPTITFYPSGIQGALEVDPTLSTTVASTTVNISVSDEFEIEMDSAKGGVIDSWYDLENDPTKSDQLADATDGLFDFYGDDALAYAETRYMRDNQQTVNALTAYDLNTSQSSTGQSSLLSTGSFNGNQNGTVDWGIRVWSRTSGGSESELTSGTPVAQVQRTSAGAGIQSNTWNCPQTNLSSTDSVVVRVYARIADKGVSWTQQAEFTTEQLNASQTESATWTIYYYTEYYTFAGTPSSQRRTDGTFYWGTSTYNSRVANFAWTGAGSERRISDSTSTTQNVIETDGRRAIVEYRGNLGAANFDYVLTYSIYSTGKIYVDFRLTNNTGLSITWRNQRAEITVDSSGNHAASGDGVATDGEEIVPGVNGWVKWAGDGTVEKDVVILYNYSGFNYVEYYASGNKVAFERDTDEVQGSGNTTARLFYLQLRPDTDILGTGESGPNSRSGDYRNPDSLADGLVVGSAWSDTDENSASDSFNEVEGVYVLNAAPSSAYDKASMVQFDLDGGAHTRYRPAFKVRKWRSTDLPAAVSLEDDVLYLGTSGYDSENYNASIKPFSEAWYEDGSASTQIADGGYTGSSDEYLNDPSNSYTLTGLTTTDTIYLGSDDQFTGVNFILSAQGDAGGAVIDWEYWNGSVWTDLTGDSSEVLGSETFETTNGSFYFTEPGDWALRQLTTTELGDSTGERTLYWVRGTSSGAYTTAPVIKRAWTDILLFQYLGDISTNDQTFVITSEAIRLSEGSIQIDVPNRYRAIMETGDTQDYILFYDRAQSDSSPNPTHEIVGPHIVEATVRYLLRWDASRTTTILESSSVRVKIRVEGCFDTAAGGACLTDGTDKITVVEDYTFTTEGMFVETMTDFRSTGITLDTAVGLNGYDWLGVYADVTDAAFDDTATPTILYGDGSTESNTSTDGAVFEDSNKYVVLPGTGSDTYQDAFVGVMRAGWYDDTGGSDTWAWDENNVISGGTTQDLITTREQDHLTIGKHYAKWFFLMLAEDDLDTEAEREGYINDFRNPDILDFTTGSEWNDAPASPGLKFPSTLGYYTECGLDSSINDLTALTWEAWIYVEAIDATNRSIFYKNLATKRLRVNATTGYLSGFIDYTDTDAEAVTTTAIPTKQWVHVTMTWSTADNIVRLFQNGVNVATSGAGVGSPGSDALSNLRFGANFYGVLDEGRMWSTVRSASDLQQNMYKELTGNESNLVGYWKVDENTGTTHYDETSNNNDCTLYGTPTWTTGFIPDHYNEAEGVYTVEASGSQVNLDIDGGANASTAVATTAVVAGVTSITVGSTTGFPTAPSVAYIDGDKFSYTGTTATTFTGIPASGELSVIGHAIGTVVSSMNRHKPMYKIRKYQLNDKPSSVTMEGSGLTEGTDYNVDYVPISDAYFADELLWYSSCESISAISTPDVGTTYSTATIESDDIVPGKYGNGFRVNASDDEIEITDISSNFDQINGSIEFWFKPNWSHTDGLLHHLFRARDAVTGDYLALSKENAVDGNDLFVYGEQGAADYFHTLIAPTDYSFTAGEWVHLRVTWDSGASSGETLRIFINGQEPTHSHNDDFKNTFDIDNGTIYFDNTNISDHADGIYDEIMIFGGSDDEPTTLAQGGNTADSSEYLFSEAQDYTLDFVPVDASNRGEYVFFSADSMFSGVNVDLETAGATGGTLNLDWEYWNGTAWASLESITGFTDGTSNLTQDGAVYWTANPTNWRKYSVNGSTDLYYIRASLNASSGTYTTSPVENLIRTDMLILQYLANVASTDQTLVVIPERLWLLMSVVFFVPGALRKKRKKHKMVK